MKLQGLSLFLGVLFFSTSIWAQNTLPPVKNENHYQLIEKANQTYPEEYYYGGLGNGDLTDDGVAVYWAYANGYNDTGGLYRTWKNGTTDLISPAVSYRCEYLENREYYCNDKLAYNVRMSPNGQYYYYIYRNLVRINDNLELRVYAINDGTSETSTFYRFADNEMPASVALNNNGDIVLIVDRIEDYSSVGGDLIRIDRSGTKTVLESFSSFYQIPYKTQDSSLIISDIGTVFVQQAAAPHSIYAFPKVTGAELQQKIHHGYGTSAFGAHRGMQATSVVTPSHPEGLLYYISDHYANIRSSSGQIIYSIGNSVLSGKNAGIHEFHITEDGDIFLLAGDGNNKQYIVKNNEILIETPQRIGNIELRAISELRVNTSGEFTFISNDYYLGRESGFTYHLFRYSEENGKRSCRVADISGREVKFFSQADVRWGDKPYAFGPKTSSQQAINANKMKYVACVTTSLAMLFDNYGLDIGGSNPDGSAKSLSPDTLNEAFKVIRDLDGKKVITYNSNNDVQYTKAAEAGRALYQKKCFEEASLSENFDAINDKKACQQNSKSQISYKPKRQERWGVITDNMPPSAKQSALEKREAGYKAIEKEICEGNPVLLRVAREHYKNGVFVEYRGHTVVAIASEYNAQGELTFKVNDPSRTENTEDITLEEMATRPMQDGPQYKHFIGYDLYQQKDDPSMIEIFGSANIDYVLTDSLGRKAGYDPRTNTIYEEIPESRYSYEITDIVSEPHEEELQDFAPKAKHLILSEDVRAGNYTIQVFGNTAGAGYLSINKTDADGFSNDTEEHVLNVRAGAVTQLNFKHSVQTLPEITSKLEISHLLYNLSQEAAPLSLHNLINRLLGLKNKQDSISLYGKITLPLQEKVNANSNIRLILGSPNDYVQNMSLKSFKRRTSQKEIFFDYDKGDYKIVISENGQFWIDIKNIDLDLINSNKWGRIILEVGQYTGLVDLSLKCNKHICSKE